MSKRIVTRHRLVWVTGRIVFLAIFLILLSSQSGFSQSNSSIRILNFEFVELKGRPAHESLFPISGQPIKGVIHTGLAKLAGSYETAEFRLVDMNGQTISNIQLTKGGAHTARSEFSGLIELPEKSFQVVVSGLDKQGNIYDSTFPEKFLAQPVELNFQPTFYDVYAGTYNISAQVTNHGIRDTFSIAATDNDLNFVTGVAPSILTLDTGETGEILVAITIPDGTPDFTELIVTASATNTTDSEISNSAVHEFNVTLRSEIIFDLGVKKASIRIPGKNKRDKGRKSGKNKSEERTKFEIEGSFSLPQESNGIDLDHGGITFTLSRPMELIPGVSQSVPSTLLTLKNNQIKYKNQARQVVGIEKIKIKEKKDKFTYQIKARNIDLSSIELNQPLVFSLQIGDDIGFADIAFDRKGKFKSKTPDEDKDKDKDKDKDDDN